MTYRKKISLAGLGLIALGLLGATDIQWAAVTDGSLNSNLKVTGRIIPQENAQSIESARVQGRVTQVLKREGELVQVGTPLFAISSADCISLMQEKQTAQKLGIQEMQDSADRRERQLGLAITAGGECRIVASHSGTLTKRQVELGATFNVGDPLANIVDIGKLTVELDIPESYLFQVKVNQPVSLELASNPGQKTTTFIKDILPYIDPNTRTSKARLVPIPLPPGTTPDFLVFGEIQTGNQQPILMVPSSALVFSHDKQYVVKQTSPQPLAIPVEVINESDNVSSIRVAPETGLSAGDMVASKGAIFLYRKLNPE
jgi:Cu(I)/Ag(I) efflux system membrane fusion protein